MPNYESNSYKKTIKDYQKKLIKEATHSEKRVMRYLERYGVKFTFQKIFTVYGGRQYIVDFYLPKYTLIIEVDGSSHIGKEVDDNVRTSALEQLGYTVIRITNQEANKKEYNIFKILNERYNERTGKGEIFDVDKYLEAKEDEKNKVKKEKNNSTDIDIRLNKYKAKIAKLKAELSYYKRQNKKLMAYINEFNSISDEEIKLSVYNYKIKDAV